MRMPQHPARWLLTILFLALVGLTAWITWAMNELETRRAAVRAHREATQSASHPPPAAP
jgi:hypothetical protein